MKTMFSEGVCHGDELFLLFKLNAIPMDPANAKDKQVAKKNKKLSKLCINFLDCELL